MSKRAGAKVGAVSGPFGLPEGLCWRAMDSRDRDWWSRVGLGVPIEDCVSFTISYILRHRETGEERLIQDRWIPFTERDRDEVLRSVAYQYTEGNFGCGCNRARFWADAHGEECPEDVVCDQKWEIVWPEWLAECDRDSCTRYEEDPADLPWNKESR